MSSPAPTRSASPIEAVRRACDAVEAIGADLRPEEWLVALQRVVARHGTSRFPDLAPESFAHAFAEGVLSILRYSPECLARSTPGSIGRADAPLAPGFWMHETSGTLRSAIEAYLQRNAPLTPEQVATLRAYFRQWIMSPVWPDSAEVTQLREKIHGLVDGETIVGWIMQAIEAGVDPL